MAGTGAPPGNDYAKKGKLFANALRKACVQDDFKRLNKGIEELLNKAEEGERWALELIRDTFDGKPKQQVEVSGDEDSPMAFELIRRVVVRSEDAK